MTRRIKTLVVAQLCNPDWYSVPLVGWNHALALREHCDVHLVTHFWNTAAILRAGWPADRLTSIDDGWVDKVHVWALHKIFKDQYGKASYTAFRVPIYWNFERLVWKALGARIAAREWDVVHRLTPVSPVNAGPLGGRCQNAGIPYVYGPINGGLPWPEGYKNAVRKEREWISSLRFLFHHLPFLARDREAAAAIMIASRVTWQQTPERYLPKAIYLPENGIKTEQVRPTPRARPVLPPLKIAFLGRLVPYKCADVALRAAAPLLRLGKATFDVIGDGSERTYLERLVAEAGIGGSVTFHGELPNKRALEVLGEAHVLAFPSIREFGGGVVVEAMASGVVPIVIDYGGPGEIVDDSAGFRLPLEDDARTEARMAAVLAELAGDAETIERLSEGARRRALDTWTWRAKAHVTADIYGFVTGQHKRRPESLPP